MPIYPTVKEASENLFRKPKPMDPLASLKANAFRPGPQWGGDQYGMGGQMDDLSEAQMVRDMEARDLISARHRQANEGIAFDEAQRGDPMLKQIEAEQKNRAYESLKPYGSTSRIRISGNALGRDFALDSGEQPMGIPSLGSVIENQRASELARAKQNPADLGRVDVANELADLESQLGALVEAGRLDPVEAQKRLAIARTRARQYADLLKPGYAPFGSGVDVGKGDTLPD
jgi:hypothetical protein